MSSWYSLGSYLPKGRSTPGKVPIAAQHEAHNEDTDCDFNEATDATTTAISLTPTSDRSPVPVDAYMISRDTQEKRSSKSSFWFSESAAATLANLGDDTQDTECESCTDQRQIDFRSENIQQDSEPTRVQEEETPIVPSVEPSKPYSWLPFRRTDSTRKETKNIPDEQVNATDEPKEDIPLSVGNNVSEPVSSPEREATEVKQRPSSFWFSYSSPSAADTLASLGNDCSTESAHTDSSSKPARPMLWFSNTGTTATQLNTLASASSDADIFLKLNSVESRESLENVSSESVDQGKFFSLVECSELEEGSEPVLCTKCHQPVTEYIVVLDDGTKWHAKCFANVMCPEDDNTALDNRSSPEGMFGSTHSSMLSNSRSHSLDDTLLDGVDVEVVESSDSKLSATMKDAISWVINAEVESLKASLNDRSIDKQEVGASDLSNDTNCAVESTGALYGMSPDEKIESSAKSDSNESAEDNASDSDNKLNRLVRELIELGMFEHNYLDHDSGVGVAKKEADADNWVKQVARVVDSSISTFPPTMYSGMEQHRSSSYCSLDCVSHASIITHCIRLKFGITLEEYLSSFQKGEVEGGDKGEGKSGKRLWFTRDRRFVIKVISSQGKCCKLQLIHISLKTYLLYTSHRVCLLNENFPVVL